MRRERPRTIASAGRRSRYSFLREKNGQKKDIQAVGTHQSEKKAKEAQLDKQRKAFRQGGFGEMFPFVFQVQELI